MKKSPRARRELRLVVVKIPLIYNASGNVDTMKIKDASGYTFAVTMSNYTSERESQSLTISQIKGKPADSSISYESTTERDNW